MMRSTESLDRYQQREFNKLRFQRQGRLAAAKINGGASAVIHRGGRMFTVTGRSGNRYTVAAATRDEIRCDCKAGIHQIYCWHAAAVYLWLLMFQANREAVPSAA